LFKTKPAVAPPNVRKPTDIIKMKVTIEAKKAYVTTLLNLGIDVFISSF